MDICDALDQGINDIIVPLNIIEDGPIGAMLEEKDQSDEEFDNTVMQNPFFVSVNGSEVVTNNPIEFYKTYDRLLLLCRRPGVQVGFDDCIFQKYIKITDFQKLGERFIMIYGPTKLARNSFHLSKIVRVDKLYLEMMSDIEFNNDEVVLPVYELDEGSVSQYLTLFENNNTLPKVLNLLTMYRYFQGNSYYPSQLKLSEIFGSIEEANFWTNPYNCGVTHTKQFMNRSFEFKKRNRAEKIIRATAGGDKKKCEELLKKITQQNDSDYHFREMIMRRDVYIETERNLEKAKYRKYRVYRSDPGITKDQVSYLFSSAKSDRELYTMFCTLAISREYVDLVVNNPVVLEKMAPVFKKHLPLFRIVMQLAFTTLYLEESILKTGMKYTDRFVFSIDTVAKLPFFPFTPEDVKFNPYTPILVDSNIIDSPNNLHGIPMIRGYKDYGINTLDAFRTRFNVFTMSDANKNIFDGLDWNSLAVSGSVITACCQKKSPLFDLVKDNTMSDAINWQRFYTEYYSNSDIDLMCNTQSVFTYMDKVMEVYNIVKTNLQEYKSEAAANSVEIKPVHNVTLIVGVQYLTILFPDHDQEYIIENINDSSIRDRFYAEYVKHKCAMNIPNRKKVEELGTENALYDDFFQYANQTDMSIVLTSNDLGSNYYSYHTELDMVVNVKEYNNADESNGILMRVCENIKFKIESPELNHNVEMFPIKDNDFFACVAKFHLPCVRAFYDGNDVYMLPSCVGALMTNININYRYFAGCRDPVQILNKYRMRGFGTILNDSEKVYVISYNSLKDESIDDDPTAFKWRNMFNIQSNNQTSVRSHFGPRNIMDNMFKPQVYLNEIPEEFLGYNTVNYEYIVSKQDVIQWYKEQSGYDPMTSPVNLFAIDALNPKGFIQPFQKWILEAGFSA